jgi:hypothetical protein
MDKVTESFRVLLNGGVLLLEVILSFEFLGLMKVQADPIWSFNSSFPRTML